MAALLGVLAALLLSSSSISYHTASKSGGTDGVHAPETSEGHTVGDGVDVVVYGSTPGAIISAVAASRHGAKTILLDPAPRVGGMCSGGQRGGGQRRLHCHGCRRQHHHLPSTFYRGRRKTRARSHLCRPGRAG